jgi:hypothetical protein
MIEPFIGASLELARGTWDYGRKLEQLRAGVRVPIVESLSAVVIGRRYTPWEGDLGATLDAALEARVPLVDHQVAIDAIVGGGVAHDAQHLPPMGDQTPARDIITTDGYGFGSATALVQMTPTLALGGGARIDVLGTDFGDSWKRLDVHAQALLALGPVDLTTKLRLDNVTSGLFLIRIDLGAVVRF